MFRIDKYVSRTYYFILIMTLINNWLSESSIIFLDYSLLKSVCLGIIISCCLFVICLSKYTKKQLAILIFLGLLSLYTAYMLKSSWIIYLTFLLVFIRGKDIKKILKLTYLCMSAFFLINTLTFAVEYVFFPESVNVWYFEGTYKYNLNFVFANEAARYWICICLLFLVNHINDKKMHFFSWIFLLAVSIPIYVLTQSESLLVIPVIFILFILKNISQFNYIIRGLAGYSFGIMWFVSCSFLILEGTNVYNLFDHIFTGRLFLGKMGIEEYGLTLFGQKTPDLYQWFVKGKHVFRMVVDNAYFYYMISYGIVYLILITILFVMSKKFLTYSESICLIVYSVIALAENNILSPSAVFPLLIAMDVIFNRRIGRNICKI